MSIINLGVVAHVDAGKTTLTEQLLYLSGEIREIGSVDKGTAQTDFLEVERQRGISVKSASTTFKWKDKIINLIDTPGHMDFGAEVERAVRVLDCAILLLSAVEGVQAQSRHIWKALRKLNIPTIFFINKIDRVGASVERVEQQIKKYFGVSPLSVDTPPNALTEILAENDEELLEKYLNEESISADTIQSSFKKQLSDGLIFPLLTGSSLKGIGVEALLDFIVEKAPASVEYEASQQASGVIFKIEHSKDHGKIAYVRLYEGKIKNRDSIMNQRTGKEEKIVQIRQPKGQRAIDVGELYAGEIGEVLGLSEAQIGDVLGTGHGVKANLSDTQPLLRVKVNPKNDADYLKLAEALEIMSYEDPLLNVQWIKEERELNINITGKIQLEILHEILSQRFGIETVFYEPSVIYKETPAVSGYGFDAYTMPKPCWAIIKFLIEPGPRGSGITYKSIVPHSKIKYKYQNQIEQGLTEALRQGPLGWEVTDAKITLVDGEDHNEHTHPLDFIVATPMAMMNGLAANKTNLLEPFISFELTIQEELSGKIIGEIINLRGEFNSPLIENGLAVFTGRLPVATSMDFPVWVASISSGQAILSTEFDGYEICPLELGRTTPYRGINPLDRAKYILYIRSALGV